MISFYDKLYTAWRKNDSFLCIGLDTDINRIPAIISRGKTPVFAFNKAVIDATFDLVCAYKPQIAYYAAIGAEDQLEMTISYLKKHHPDIPVILDAKRGDIGATAEMYAGEAYDRYGADAVTVNPYMGGDTLKPFLDRKDKGVVILCKTSNPGSHDFQNAKQNNRGLFLEVAKKAQTDWNYNNNIMLVVGATFPEEMAKIRKTAPELPFLVPGVGFQGGNPENVIQNGVTRDGYGLVVNSSRGIIYAGDGDDFAQKSRESAIILRNALKRPGQNA